MEALLESTFSPDVRAPSALPGGVADRGCPARSAGLVSSPTSGTRSDLIELDPIRTRLRRMTRSVLTAVRVHEFELRGQRWKPAMLTLTYRTVGDWAPHHISNLLQRVRVYLRRRKIRFRYVWVGELQQRGALHYHVIAWLPRGVTLPKPDKQGWWPHGSTRIEWARRPAAYLAKYASKLDSKAGLGFPPGARLHGKGGFDDFGRSVAQWFNLPAWAREVCDLAGRAVRVKGVGLVERTTGVCLPSPWRVSRDATGTFVAQRCWSYLNALREVAGPFSWLQQGQQG